MVLGALACVVLRADRFDLASEIWVFRGQSASLDIVGGVVGGPVSGQVMVS